MSQKLLMCLEKQISNHLKTAGVLTRPVEGNGLWCPILLPTIFILSNFKDGVSPAYSMTSYVAVGLMLYSLLFVVFVSVSSIMLSNAIFSGITACGLISAVIIYCFANYDLHISLITGFSTIFVYTLLLRFILKKFPKCFTIGEAMVVSEGIVLFAVMSITKLLVPYGNEYDFVHGILYSYLFSVGLMAAILYLLPETHKTVTNLTYTVCAGALMCVLLLIRYEGIDFIYKFIMFIFESKLRVKILSLWFWLLLMSCVIVYAHTKRGNKADTGTRKVFHILASLVFMTGILFDKQLIVLSSGIAFGLIIFIEFLRKSKIEPFSKYLQAAFEIYCDEKDAGDIAMTAIYLFVGLACPLVLVPDYTDADLVLLSGVLSVGISDTAASWLGSRYGANKWSGSERTMEGTAFYIFFQVITVYTLKSLNLLNMPFLLEKTGIVACVSGLVEAKTDQVDNLILPLVTILGFIVSDVV